MSRHILVVLISAAAAISAGTAAAPPGQGDTKTPSRIIAATVYTDRAMVTREGSAEVTPGIRHITLGGLPPFLQDQSVRVSASGTAQAKILEVKVDRKFLDSVSADRIAPLLQTRQSITDDLRALNDRLAVISHQRDFLNKITIASEESVARELKTQRPTTEDWNKVLGFFDVELSKLNTESRQLEDKSGAIQQKLNAVQREINAAGGSPDKVEKAITVAFDVRRGGTLAIETSYLISQAGWTPTYDIRVSSADTIVELTYSAFVRQNTGEEWKDVSLTLSTSQPSLGGAPPELPPWYVGAAERAQGTVEGSVRDAATGEPLVGANIIVTGTPAGAATDVNGYYRINGLTPGPVVLKSSYVGYQSIQYRVSVRPFALTRANFSLPAEGVAVGTVAITAMAQGESLGKLAATSAPQNLSSNLTAVSVPPRTADVKESLIAASFPISGESTVPSDNREHRVTIAVVPLGGTFSHSAVPKLQAEAFFKAGLRNSTDYPIIPGPMSVYVDNAFVSTSKLPMVMPGEKFDAYLGADNGVHVERKLLNKVTDVSGVFSKSQTTKYEILITAENRKKIPQTLTLRENVPVSQDERVKVQIDLPRPEEAKPDAGGILTWQVRLAPGEKREFRVQYSIEAPTDMNVGGLE
jgi:hypothetical protein